MLDFPIFWAIKLIKNVQLDYEKEEVELFILNHRVPEISTFPYERWANAERTMSERWTNDERKVSEQCLNAERNWMSG